MFFLDQVNKVKVLLKNFRRHWQILQLKFEKQTYFKDILMAPVIDGRIELLETLIRGNIKERNGNDTNRDEYIARDWARILRMDRCYDILSKHDHSCYPKGTKRSKKTNPVMEILTIAEPVFDRQKCIDKLVDLGYDVNFEGDGGITPVLRAICSKDYKSMHALLMNGANPFKTKVSLPKDAHKVLVKEIFYCNVDVADHLLQLLSYIWNSEDHKKYFCFALKCVHTLTNTDREKLKNSLQFSIQKEFRDEIQEVFETVPSLFILCRNAIRRSCPGKYIHRFVRDETIPKSLVKVLLLEEEMNSIGGYNPPWKNDELI